MTTTRPQPIDDFNAWFQAFLQPTVLIEFAALAVAVVLAWGLASLVRRAQVGPVPPKKRPSGCVYWPLERATRSAASPSRMTRSRRSGASSMSGQRSRSGPN